MPKEPLKEPKNASQKPYKALTPIQHNHENYAVGDRIDLTEDEADQLIEVNAIALIG
jgi:hypothetical protein